MVTVFNKGRWYKAKGCGDYYLINGRNEKYWTYSCVVSQSVGHVSILLDGRDLRPFSFTEVSPNEVLQSIKTDGLSPKQLKEIAEVFFVDGVRFRWRDAYANGLVKHRIGHQLITSDTYGVYTCCGDGRMTIRYNNGWATIISHPAYGDKDLREYEKVKEKKGCLGTISASFNFKDGRVTVSKEIADALNDLACCHSDSQKRVNEIYQSYLDISAHVNSSVKEDQPKKEEFKVLEYQFAGRLFSVQTTEATPLSLVDRKITRIRRESDGEIFEIGDHIRVIVDESWMDGTISALHLINGIGQCTFNSKIGFTGIVELNEKCIKESQPKRKVSELRENEAINCKTEKEARELDKMFGYNFHACCFGDTDMYLLCVKAIRRDKIHEYTIYPASDFLPKSFYEKNKRTSK